MCVYICIILYLCIPKDEFELDNHEEIYAFLRYYRSEDGKDYETVSKETEGTVFYYVTKLEELIQGVRAPDGSAGFPAKTCADLKLSHSDVESGEYHLDANLGSAEDNFTASCHFTPTTSETCIHPTKKSFDKKKWVPKGKDGFRWFLRDIAVDEEVSILL